MHASPEDSVYKAYRVYQFYMDGGLYDFIYSDNLLNKEDTVILAKFWCYEELLSYIQKKYPEEFI
jgi:hypothetical protein